MENYTKGALICLVGMITFAFAGILSAGAVGNQPVELTFTVISAVGLVIGLIGLVIMNKFKGE